MSKKKKKEPAKAAPSKQEAAGSPKRSRYPLLVLCAGAVLLIAGGFYLYQGRQQPPESYSQAARSVPMHAGLLETRPTLPPTMFSGTVREAYAIARDIPQVLDKLYCYCRCRENFGHKNLLSCYVDTHAST
jgi:Protein of unknown function with PCYCGC motif